MGRVMAIDYGDRRIGLAVSDPTATLCGEALTIINRGLENAAQAVAEEVAGRGVDTLVLGLPKNMDGSEGERAALSREFAALLKEKCGLEPVLWDERRSSIEAHAILHANGKKMKQHKKSVDAVAASLILKDIWEACIDIKENENMGYDIILFDLDGTLTDSGPGIMNAAAYAMKRYGLPKADEALLRRFVGPPLADSFKDFCGFDEGKAHEAIGVFREYYEPKGVFENSVYPGVFEMLDTLKQSGKRLAVATSKLESTALRVLEHFKLAHWFELAAGSLADNTRTRKAEVVSYVLERMGVTDKSRALMVGDREHDVIGARENGLETLGVLYGYGSREELETAGAAMIAATPQEAAELIVKAN